MDEDDDPNRNYDKARVIEENEPEDRHHDLAVQTFVTELSGEALSSNAGLIEKTFRTLDFIEELLIRVEEVEKENTRLRERLDAFGDIGVEKTSKQSKIASIVQYADNLRNEDQGAIKILPKNVCGVANVSRRYAYDLIDDMIHGDGENGTVGPDGFAWAHDPTKIDQYGSLEKKESQKGILIDFEGIHGEPLSVNKFNTGSTTKEVAD
ncbi:hypothetical protein SAMN04488066_11569 [Halorubrum aquaticum]|uniref:Uncharacterized protein n=1 Tax=Halorubrum aquaticum TaxID=387340 RepID=A0A1I3BV95_9EURY|nr:hypothetical protein [Halorubrum aquaticum]SFH65899.1 hypothetical protein SAMN04488066_11569 [Halorubrum aquaticum]